MGAASAHADRHILVHFPGMFSSSRHTRYTRGTDATYTLRRGKCSHVAITSASRISCAQATPRDFLLIGRARISAASVGRRSLRRWSRRTRIRLRTQTLKRGDTTMKKIAIATALILGTATAAFAEDSSSSFSFNIYPQGGVQQQRVLQRRDVPLPGRPSAIVRSQTFDRASNPYAGGI